MEPSSPIAPNQAPAEHLAHGFKRTLFGFSPSLKKTSNKYGYLFRTRSPKASLPFSSNNQQVLERLGRSMIDSDGRDEQSGFSGIDAGYTYFGQFVDHDLTLDVDSKTSQLQDARQLTNYRTPNLDLDSLYGAGPAVSAYMYDTESLLFILGRTSGQVQEFDLPRTTGANSGLAIIGDPRNDENLFVAQFHMSMLRFHNAVIEALRPSFPPEKKAELFTQAQKEVRQHYQWVVFHDYLRTLIGSDLLNELLSNGPTYFTREKHPSFFMPVEFSVAAYRFGHSLIRNHYHFNASFSDASFSNAFGFTKGTLPSIWNVHWPSFFGTAAQPAVNKARKIDTRVAFSMGNLPLAPGAAPQNMFTVLSARNLVRSMALNVPTGQYVAKRMGQTPLSQSQLLSSPYTNPTDEQIANHKQQQEILLADNGLLIKQTPLWFYILKEAEVLHRGEQLGPVGGGIIGEVFMRLLVDSEEAFIHNPEFRPQYGFQGTDARNYKISDMLRFAGTYPIPNLQ